MKLLYFAWLRAKIGTAEETVELPTVRETLPVDIMELFMVMLLLPVLLAAVSSIEKAPPLKGATKVTA